VFFNQKQAPLIRERRAPFIQCYEDLLLTEKFSQKPLCFFVPLVSGRYQAKYRESGLATHWRNRKKALSPSVWNSSTSFGIMVAMSHPEGSRLECSSGHAIDSLFKPRHPSPGLIYEDVTPSPYRRPSPNTYSLFIFLWTAPNYSPSSTSSLKISTPIKLKLYMEEGCRSSLS
jgi:hypothetical protein